MGAWIETYYFTVVVYSAVVSHPMWVRGLKLSVKPWKSCKRYVAPYVGAWIETRFSFPFYNFAASHPMWVRGLKHASLQQ